MSLYDFRNISILEVSARIGIVVKKNSAFCFAHEEKTPSLFFNEKKGVYYCHGCGIRGNVFSLVRAVLKLDNKATHQWLQNNYLSGKNPLKINNALPRKNSISPVIEKEVIIPNPEIYEWLINELTLSKVGTDYLTNERGFNHSTITKLRIRDIPYPNRFFSILKNRWGESELLKAGLARIGKDDQIKFIWWDHVIIFPFIDLQGKLSYLQARRMKNDGKFKYLNLQGVRRGVYNINCLPEMSPGERLFICEGVTDTITMIERGVRAIGFLGANGFDNQFVPLLLDYSLYLLPDYDLAGQGMARKVADTFLKCGKPIKVVKLPSNKKDVNEVFKSNS